MARKTDVFVNIYTYDPWWVRWLTMLHFLHKVQLTFGGTRGFRRKNSSVTVFADVKGRATDHRIIAGKIAAAIADVLVSEGIDEQDIGGYVFERNGRTEPVRSARRVFRS